jgi:hypothetical protein
MRGFYLKNAQLMSTRDEFVPKQYIGWCKETQVSPCTNSQRFGFGFGFGSGSGSSPGPGPGSGSSTRPDPSATWRPPDTPPLLICCRRITARPSSWRARLGCAFRQFSGILWNCRRLLVTFRSFWADFTWEMAQLAAERELGKPLGEMFERWDDEPMAVASIGISMNISAFSIEKM